MRYQPYRGQRSQRWKTIRNIFIILLCLFIVLCAIFLLFFQDNFRAWYEEHRPAPKEPTSTSQDVQSQVGGAKEPSTEPTSEDHTASGTPAVPSIDSTRILELPSAALSNPAYWQQVLTLASQGKISGVSIVVKNPEGYVPYPSSYSLLAGTNIISDTSSNLQDAINTFKNAGLPVTAVLYTHQDHLFAQRQSAAALKNVDRKAWRTGDSKCWLDPTAPDTTQYLTALITECKAMGFDEVLLRGLGWPPAGRLNRIVYGKEYSSGAQRATFLAAQVKTFAEAASPMKLSVCLDDATAANGLAEASGQDVAQLYAVASQVFARMSMQTETSGNSMREIIAGFTGGDSKKVVPMYSSAALAPGLFAGSDTFYFVPSETNGALESYLQ